VLDAEGVELIHEASMAILEEAGIDFRDAEAIDLWKKAGAKVEGERVYIDRALLLELTAKNPEVITLHGRNPARTVKLGGPYTIFAPSYGSPFVLDLEGERRYSTLADLEAFHKLAYLSPGLHVTGAITCEPVDIPVAWRAMAKLVMGEDFVEDNTVMVSVCNCNSPRVWDETMLDAVKVYARHNQSVILAPFVMAGASTPASSVGSVAQLNAEALAGVAFAQLVRPGAPMIYGQFLATVSMKSGAPMGGTPEISLMNFMVGQMARRYKLPWRSSAMVNGSKLVDAQAAYESAMTMQSMLLAGASYAFHSAGWLEAGLTASFAKFVLDAEQVEMYYKLGQGVTAAELADLKDAMAALRQVAPGGHYLGTDHTREHFETAFYMPELLDNNSFEQWQAEGAADAATRATVKAQELIRRHDDVAPALDPALDEALLAFIKEREKVLPEGVS
jgi:trimethylamine--corrinoid protein Co-methyltransferase